MADPKTDPKTKLMRPMTPKREAAFEAMLKAMGKDRREDEELMTDFHDLMALAFPSMKIMITFEEAA